MIEFMSFNHMLFPPHSHHRQEIPPKEDQREEAAHKGVDCQAAAVHHLEDGERLLWICPGAVPVRQGACCPGKGRGTLPARPKFLLWKNLPQKLEKRAECFGGGRNTLSMLSCALLRQTEVGVRWDLRTTADCVPRLRAWCGAGEPIRLWRSDRTGSSCYSRLCRPAGRGARVSIGRLLTLPAAPPLPFTSTPKVVQAEGLSRLAS